MTDIRNRYAELLGTLAVNKPTHIQARADGFDIAERRDHLAALVGAVAAYATEALTDINASLPGSADYVEANDFSNAVVDAIADYIAGPLDRAEERVEEDRREQARREYDDERAQLGKDRARGLEE